MLSFFPPEQFYGNQEYKLCINPKKKDRILSQFLFRLREGHGKAIYFILTILLLVYICLRHGLYSRLS